MNDEFHTYLGTTETGFGAQDFYISKDARYAHMALLGASGSGKSHLMREIGLRDIKRGDGLLYLDPHSDDVGWLLDRIPAKRRNHVVLIDLAQLEYSVPFNILECRQPDDRARIADTLISSLKDIWMEAWGPRLELVLRHSALALLEVPGSTIMHIAPLLTNDAFRRAIVFQVSNPITRRFFEDRFEEWRDAYRTEAIEPVLTRLDAVLSFPALLHSLSQHQHTLSLEDAMASQRIILVNLARGIVGETAASFYGAILFARARAAAMARARLVPEDRSSFWIHIDEAQAIASASIPSAMQELRKYAVGITIATQTLASLSERTRSAILGSVATIGAFRIGPEDAELIAARFSELHRDFNPAVFNELVTAEPFIKTGAEDARRVRTPAASPSLESAEIVRRQTKRHYGRAREDVEPWVKSALEKIAARQKAVAEEEKKARKNKARDGENGGKITLRWSVAG